MLAVIITVGLATIMGKNIPLNSNTVRTHTIGEASAAMVWQWAPPSGSSGTNGTVRWNTFPNPNAGTSGAGSQIIPVSHVPQPGYPLNPGTNGISFDMNLEVPSSIDIVKSGSFSTLYVLEYELPKAEAGGSYSWETNLSLTVQHGIMYAPDGSEPEGYASLMVFAIEDPEGRLGIAGSGQPQLKQKLLEKLGEIPKTASNGIVVESETNDKLRYFRGFNGSFAVAPGVTPKLFFAVSSQFVLQDGGNLCISWCTQGSMADMARFEVQNTGPDPGVTVLTLIQPDPYMQQVQSYREQYGKSAEWEQWMLDNRSRYFNAFNKARNRPDLLTIAFRYDTALIAYDPPWTNEAEHMGALETLMEAAYPGYDFRFDFNGDAATAYANAVAGISSTTSSVAGNTMHLYYETIINHEFAHIMAIPHHYDSDDQAGEGNHMPPGESTCLMDKTSTQYCSACRTALHLPLDVDNGAAIDAAVNEIRRRIPY